MYIFYLKFLYFCKVNRHFVAECDYFGQVRHTLFDLGLVCPRSMSAPILVFEYVEAVIQEFVDLG